MTVDPAQPATLPIFSHWIGGRPVEVAPEQTGPVYNPATGEVIARVPRGGQAEVDAAVAAARAAFPAWRDMPLIARSAIFFAYREQLWRAPRGAGRAHHPRSRQDVPRRAGGGHAGPRDRRVRLRPAGPPRRPEHPERLDEGRRPHPPRAARGRGRDHALQLPGHGPDVDLPDRAWPAATPSSGSPPRTRPGATQLQAELWKEAGLPDGVFNIVYGGREAVSAICEHPGIDAIQFVGSTPVGRYVYETGTRAQQAGRRLHGGQERDDRPARRRPGPRGRLGGRRGLRLAPASAAWPRRS